MQNLAEYETEARKFASPHFHTEKVTPTDLYDAMYTASAALHKLDLMRKAIFYENREYARTPSMKTMRFFDKYPDLDPNIIHAILGSACEGGEKLDLLMRAFEGEAFDTVNYNEEVGDGIWFDALGLGSCGLSLEGTMTTNIKKLDARSKGKREFSKDNFNERDLLTERETLEKNTLPEQSGDKERVRKDG